MQVKYNMVVDFARPNKSNTILVAEDDANSRKCYFTLLFDKEPFDMTGVTTATILGITSTGARIYADATIETDDEGNIINAISWVIPAALTDTAGNITLTVTLTDNVGARITSFEFYVKVRNALYNEDDFIDEDDMEGFRDLLARTRAALEKMEQMVEQDALPNPYPIRIDVDNVEYEYNGDHLVEILMGEVAYLGARSGTVDITADDSAAAQAARSAAEAAQSAEDADDAYTNTRLIIDNFQSQIPTATVTKNVATHQSIIVITDKNGTTSAVVEDGVIGSSWYAGTDLTGTTTNITGYAGNAGDYYLNTVTGNVYRCTTTGDITTALWDYVLTMGSNNFGRVKVAATTITASGNDILELKAGDNVTLVPNDMDKSVTIHAAGGGGGGTSDGDMKKSVYDDNNDGIVNSADTLHGLQTSIAELNYVQGVTSSIQTQLSGKAAASHTHTTSDITDLSIPDELADLADDATHRLVTDTEKTTWNGKQDVLTAGTGISIDTTTNTISATASTQLGYKRVKVGNTNIDASQAEDTIEFEAGVGMTITPDAANKKITFISSGGGGTSTGDMLKIVYDQDNNGIVDRAETLDDGTTSLTASISELNYVDGVTSNIQTQLDGKAASSHTHMKSQITDFPTIPTALIQLDCTGDQLHRVVTDAQISAWNQKQNALQVGAGVDITNNTISIDTDSSPVSGSAKPITSGGVYTAFNNLGDLAQIDIDGASSTKFLQGDGTWQNPPRTGHEMIPTTNDIATITALQNGNDNYVLNAYSAKRWSNTDSITLLTTVAQGDDTMGTWEADDTWQTSGVRTGWLCHSLLADILSDNDTEIELVFDIKDSETVSAYAYRIDDHYTVNGETVGGIAIKFNGAIQNASGVKVGVKLKHNRATYINVSRT